MKKYFITSDVHGYYSILMDTLIVNNFDINNKDHILIVCGDLFDRGDEAVKVLTFVQSLGDRFIYIRGNHEDLLEKCYQEITRGWTPEDYHWSNGTVQTISQFCGVEIWNLSHPSSKIITQVQEKISPIIQYINNKSLNYYTIDNNILVHSWIPLNVSDKDYFTPVSVYENWNKNRAELSEQERVLYDQLWQDARWGNPFELWKKGFVLPGKTIICGHWHCSWANSHYHRDGKEFYPKEKMNWEPFKDEGIIGIDACTAYSGHLNCIIISKGNKGEKC